MAIKPLLLTLAITGSSLLCYSQASLSVVEQATAFPAILAGKVSTRIASLESKIDKQAARYLERLQNREAKMRRKLARKDSTAAATIFADAEQKYQQLNARLNNPPKYKEYVPYLDTLSSALKFAEQQKLLSKSGAVPTELQHALSNIEGLESQLHKAETIKQFLKDRKQFLRAQLGRFGFGRELQQLNKDVYYYSQYINEYKSLLHSPEKLERKAIELLTKTAVFQEFLQKHGFLASIFRVPGDPGSAAFQANLAGLQTSAQVNQLMQQQLGSTASGSVQTLQQNLQQAQGQLQQMKDKVLKSVGSGDEEMPGFKPNNQKTKNFLQRLELGTNFQTQRATNYFPVTSDIGLSLGYKLNDKSILGFGASYALGLGSGWRDIKLSSQGMGLRSFIDWRLIKSFWLSGGFEMNYRNVFNEIDQLKVLNGWQQSGLLGISKTIAMKTKFLKKTKLSVLWDFLSYQQVPQTPAIKFRVGYSF